MKGQLQTPFFLIKEDLLFKNIEGFQLALSEIWPNSIIAYSEKTNALPWILKWMNKHGIFAEVVSDEEYQIALLAGYEGKNIVFNGPVKTDDGLTVAFDSGSIINIDSKRELEYLKKNKPVIDGNLGIRVNVESSIFNTKDVDFQEDGFRFGFCERTGELKHTINTIRNIYGDTPIGLHMHVNSITRAVDVYKAIAEFGVEIIKKYDLNPSFIDIGGGFFGGVPGKATPKEYINAVKKELCSVVDVNQTKLIIEPGSALIGSAVELHTSVLDVKDTAHARIVTTDGSRIYVDPLWQKKSYTYTSTSSSPMIKKQIICGYTCMDHDRLMEVENQPELSIGDRIIYHRVGNYTITFGGPFIKPFPSVYVDNGTCITIVRKQMTTEEYYRMETEVK